MQMMKEIEERTAEEQRKRLEVVQVKSKLEEVERKHVVALQAEKQASPQCRSPSSLEYRRRRQPFSEHRSPSSGGGAERGMGWGREVRLA